MTTNVETPPLTTVVFPLVRVALVLRSKVLAKAKLGVMASKINNGRIVNIFFIRSPLKWGSGGNKSTPPPSINKSTNYRPEVFVNAPVVTVTPVPTFGYAVEVFLTRPTALVASMQRLVVLAPLKLTRLLLST